MKARHGFVSNSSSSSFVIRLDRITEEQITKIEDFVETDECLSHDGDWYIFTHNSGGIFGGQCHDTYGSTLFKYMEELGVNSNDIVTMDY